MFLNYAEYKKSKIIAIKIYAKNLVKQHFHLFRKVLDKRTDKEKKMIDSY